MVTVKFRSNLKWSDFDLKRNKLSTILKQLIFF